MNWRYNKFLKITGLINFTYFLFVLFVIIDYKSGSYEAPMRELGMLASLFWGTIISPIVLSNIIVSLFRLKRLDKIDKALFAATLLSVIIFFLIFFIVVVNKINF